MSVSGWRQRLSLSSLLYPATCAGCGERGTWLCDRCQPRVPRFASLPGLCRRCGLPLIRRQCGCRDLHPRIVTARSLFPYIDWVAESLRGIKYHGERDRAAFLGALLANDQACCALLERADVIVPVPMHPRRERHRGYNQAYLYALAACRAIGREEFLSPLLVRTEDRVSQVDTSGDERRTNVRGSFALAEPVEPGQRIVLFDDVRTTGATVSACAEAVRAARPARIDVVTVAAELYSDTILALGLAQ